MTKIYYFGLLEREREHYFGLLETEREGGRERERKKGKKLKKRGVGGEQRKNSLKSDPKKKVLDRWTGAGGCRGEGGRGWGRIMPVRRHLGI